MTKSLVRHKIKILTSEGGITVPELLLAAGPLAGKMTLEFFTAEIINKNTFAAYGRAVGEFCEWLETHGLTGFQQVTPLHVAIWVRQMQDMNEKTGKPSIPTIKLRLAAVKALCDWLVTKGVLPSSPAVSVRGPRYTVSRGKTPVLDPAQMAHLLNAIETDTIVGLRDRALIGLMAYSFARIGAALKMTIGDLFWQRNRLWIRLHEKNSKEHEMPCHHRLEEYLTAYIEKAKLKKDSPLFPRLSRVRKRTELELTDQSLTRDEALAMVKRRARKAGVRGWETLCNHTMRGTGITAFLLGGGTLERASKMASHADPRTTRLYDRRNDNLSLDDVERIIYE